ncbi:MAG: insulinase family protein, partial [Novosphingobium sp.]
GVEQRELQPGANLADEIVQALDIRETVASPDTVLGIFDRSKALFTPEAVLAHTRSQFAGTVTRAFMVTPAEGEVSIDALRQAMAAPVAADASARIDTKPVSFADLPPIGVEAQPTTITPTGLAGIEQLDFANGVKAQIWPTSDEPGRVTVKVRFGSGYRSFGAGDAPVIALGQAALINVGVGPLGEEELDRISTGRKMGFAFRIADGNFSFSGDTRRDDLADQLYLFAAKLSQPRWDTNPLARAKAQSRLQYDALATSPSGVLNRDLDWLQRGRDPRYRMPLPAEVAAVTPARFRAVWEPILLSGPVEVQVFGDIDHDQTVAALSRTFGALKPRLPLTHPIAPAFTRVPAGGGAPVVLNHHGDATQSAAMIFWPTSGGVAGVRESRQLRILAEVFSNRLLDRMREKLGASYSPQVYSAWPVDLVSGGEITALAQLQPKDVPAFYEVADEIAADLVARPPSPDELVRVTEPLRQLITRAYTGSNYFMSQIEGATTDPRRYAAVRTLLPDSTVTTPAAMQALAAKYLVRAKSWRLAVLPQAQPQIVNRAAAPSATAGR